MTADRTAANLATVQEIYAAFGRGDIPAILDVIADDCRWEAWADNSAQRAGVPYLQPRFGPSGVGEFFAAVAELEIRDFQVLDCIAGRDQVAAEILIEASTPAGGRFRDEELHLWTLGADGRIVRLRHAWALGSTRVLRRFRVLDGRAGPRQTTHPAPCRRARPTRPARRQRANL